MARYATISETHMRAAERAVGFFLQHSILSKPTPCESPIEDALWLAFNVLSILPGAPGVWTLPASSLSDNDYLGLKYAFVLPQQRIGRYRADFLVDVRLISAKLSMRRKIVVECDGREFHAASTDQVDRDKARDRALIAAGCSVMRFPGWEIMRDPFECAIQVGDAVRAVSAEFAEEMKRIDAAEAAE